LNVTKSDARSATPALPAATGLSHVRVYDSAAPDGTRGGCPHVHLACTELYYVTAGTGAVELFSMGGYQRIRLEPGRVVYFTPGVIHRLVNEGDLEVLVLMENGGLPESGDSVLTFPPSYLQDLGEYVKARTPRADKGNRETGGCDDAMRPVRDLAVRGFSELVSSFQRCPEAGFGQLRTFYRQAAALIQPVLPGWQPIVDSGIAAATNEVRGRLTALANGRGDHLEDGLIVQLPGADEKRTVLGTCGFRQAYLPEGISVGALAPTTFLGSAVS
jgi:mannose-6-phosphate isomerase-like protein (cupin superfamily)